jgi:hypothetical protein
LIGFILFASGFCSGAVALAYVALHFANKAKPEAQHAAGFGYGSVNMGPGRSNPAPSRGGITMQSYNDRVLKDILKAYAQIGEA